MASSIESERLPRGSRGWRTFIEALARVDDTAESYWLEMKVELDLTRSGAAKMAKFILGAANRLPDSVARAIEGHALIVFGVANGAMPGVEPVEDLELEKRIQPYLGAEGPRWETARVAVGHGRDVLIIIVEPPRMGDPIYICRREGDGVADGDVYVRARGETRRAKSGEMDLLRARERGGVPNVELEVSVAGPVLAYECDPAAVNEYVEHRRRSLLDHLPKPKPPATLRGSAAAQAASLANFADGVSLTMAPVLAAMTIAEDRSEEAYTDAVEAWADSARRSLPGLLDAFIAREAPATKFFVRNLTSQFLSDVQLHLHLAGPVEQVEADDFDMFRAKAHLPREPRPWGPRQRDLIQHVAMPSSYGLDLSHIRPAGGPQATFRNGGSVDATFDLPELRPHGVEEFDGEVILVVRDPLMTVIEGQWSATAQGVHAVFEGSISVPVDEPRDVTDLIRKSLRSTKV